MKSVSKVGSAAACCLLIGGCNSIGNQDPAPTGSTADLPAVSVDVGDGKQVDFAQGEPLRAIFLGPGAGYTYTDAQLRGAKETAAELGIDLAVADGRSQGPVQVQQAQDAIQSGKYNAVILSAFDADQFCGIATKQMPSAGMLVVTAVQPVCDRGSKDGLDAWSPGTLAYVGGNQLPAAYRSWADRIVKENPGPQKVIVAAGPKGVAPADNAFEALQDAAQGNTDFEIVAEVQTNLTTPDAQQKMQDALQAHPDATVIASMYPEITKGVVVALKQSGRSGGIRVYDAGADSRSSS